MPETSLYPAVKRFLEAANFDVKGEVTGCDIVARAGATTCFVIWCRSPHCAGHRAEQPGRT